MSMLPTETLPESAGVSSEAQPHSPPPPVAVSLGSLQRPLPDSDQELLRHRFLCRGGGLLLAGPTGIGKSSLSMQFMISWALGRHVFGIEPARPLKSLLIQAENDDGDLAEMRDGVVKGLDLTDDQKEEAFSRILVVHENCRAGANFFMSTVRPLLDQHRPDLLWIDPALAFLEGQANAQEDVGEFLRRQLNPLLDEFQCAAVVVHHTNKPPKKGESNGSMFGESAYIGAGSAEWANWARAVLALRATASPGVLELNAGKRGGRLRWVAEDDETRLYSKMLAHAKGEGEIYWRPATEGEIEGTSGKGKTVGPTDGVKVLGLVPITGSIEKSNLLERCKQNGIGRDRANKVIQRLTENDRIFVTAVPRTGKRPEIHFSQALGSSRPVADDGSPCPPSSQPPCLPSGLVQNIRDPITSPLSCHASSVDLNGSMTPFCPLPSASARETDGGCKLTPA